LRGRIRASRPAFAGWGFGAGDLLGERLRLCVVGSSFAQGVELALRLADSALPKGDPREPEPRVVVLGGLLQDPDELLSGIPEPAPRRQREPELEPCIHVLGLAFEHALEALDRILVPRGDALFVERFRVALMRAGPPRGRPRLRRCIAGREPR
jgi:hypothetical protein